jgi:hypothetical protein
MILEYCWSFSRLYDILGYPVQCIDVTYESDAGLPARSLAYVYYKAMVPRLTA